MLWIIAIVLGVIQGIGEFLPISSSAHLIISRWLFGWDEILKGGGNIEIAFDVALHLGTLIAVLLYFYQELEVKRIFIKSRFIEEFEKKEFFDKDRVSDTWKEYLMMLYYERSKINIHKYFEELICDYYDEPSYEIKLFRMF